MDVAALMAAGLAVTGQTTLAALGRCVSFGPELLDPSRQQTPAIFN
jgi:hypothetical protein